MHRTNLVTNLEAYVQQFREMLSIGSLDGLQKAARDAAVGLANIKAISLDDDRVRSGVDTVAEYMNRFADCLEHKNRQEATKALILMEEAVQEMRREKTVAEQTGMSIPE